ncbi:MAG TPA: DNA translocase FtsK, partial [bacterium]
MSGSSKTKRASSKRRQGSDRRRRDGWREVLGIVLLALAILTTLALATYPPPNLLRGLGDGISNFIIPFTLGRWPSFVFPFLLFFWSGAVLLRWKRIRVFWGSMGALLLALWASFLIFLVEAPEIITVHTGLLGWAFGDMISNFMGAIGAWILWSLVVMTALILFLRFRPSLILRKSLDVGKPAAAGLWAWLLEQFKRRPSEPLEDTVALELEPEISNLADLPSEEPLPADQELEIPTQQQSLSLETPARILPDAPLRPKGEYHLPPLTLLNDPPPDSPDAPDELRSKAKRLQAALADFGVGAKVVKVNPGPVITRFDLEPDPGVKVSRISALADDLALVLRARAIRIQAPIPGQGAVGVEIPNRQPSTVVLKSVLAHSSFQDHKSLLAIALGQTAAGDPYVSDLSKMPHLLVAGTTGSGKSVCLHSIIASLLFRNPPN